MAVLRPGDKIAGKYRIENRLGSGGMATVYHCIDPDLGVPVAIKVLHEHLLADNPEVVERFRREAKLMARLSHPSPHSNLVAVRHVIIRPDLMAIIMELIENGQGLDEWLDEQGPLPEAKAIDLMRGVLAGMAYTHERGVLHRDIKPSNILLARQNDGSWLPKVTDFGIAKSMDEAEIGEGMSKLTQDASMFGSPAYMAPELFDSATESSPQSDIYALGVMLFELVTGSVPFPVDSIPAHVMRVSTQPAPSPREVRPELSTRLEQVLSIALAKEPEQRFSSTQAFLDALEGDASAMVGGNLEAGDPERIGQVYRVERRLGRGPLGTVYGCIDESLGVPVAVKVLTEPSYRDRFLSVTKSQAKLHQGRAHPNIVAIRHTFANPDLTALVLERVEGLPLDRFVTEARPDLPTVLQLFGSAADALTYAQGLKVLHLNLKPSNLLIAWQASAAAAARKRPRAKLSDFGMGEVPDGSRLAQAQRSDAVKYLAPELRTDGKVKPTAAADTFSLGVLLLYALLGNLPQAEEPNELQAKVPTSIAPQLRRILLAALDADPGKRPEMSTFRDTLQSVYTELTGEEASGILELGSFVLPTPNEKRSSLGLIIGLAAAALLVAVAIFLVLELQGGDDATASPAGEATTAAGATPDVVEDTTPEAPKPDTSEPPKKKGPTMEERQEAAMTLFNYLEGEAPQANCLPKLNKREVKKLKKLSEGGRINVTVVLAIDPEGKLLKAELADEAIVNTKSKPMKKLTQCLIEELEGLESYPALGFAVEVDKPFIWFLK